MFVNCINQYLNTEYESKNNGDLNEILDAFIFYFEKINCLSKVKQLNVVKNCGLFYEVNCFYENLAYFINNTQDSLNYVYEKQKQKLLNLLKQDNNRFANNMSP